MAGSAFLNPNLPLPLRQYGLKPPIPDRRGPTSLSGDDQMIDLGSNDPLVTQSLDVLQPASSMTSAPLPAPFTIPVPGNTFNSAILSPGLQTPLPPPPPPVSGTTSTTGAPGSMGWWGSTQPTTPGIITTSPNVNVNPTITPPPPPPPPPPPTATVVNQGIEGTQAQQLTDYSHMIGVDISDLDLTTDAGQSAAIDRLYAGSNVTSSSAPLAPDAGVNTIQSQQIQDLFDSVITPVSTPGTPPPPPQPTVTTPMTIQQTQSQQISDYATMLGVDLAGIDLTTDAGQSEALLRLFNANPVTASTAPLAPGASVDQIQSQQILDLSNSIAGL